MAKWLVERRLASVGQRLRSLREELAVIEEQLQQLADEADDARIRALVSETALADREHHDARRHADAMAARRDEVRTTIAELEVRQDVLLDELADGLTRPAGGPDAPPCLDGPVGLRVLIAEDEAIIRLDLRETLEEEGYEVAGETGRGDEAVTMARELSPDLAVLDIGMPGMDGLEAARLMVGEQLCGVLILTAFSQRELIEQARDAGALAYLVKPFQKSDLVPALELAYARHRELQALGSEVRSLEERLESRKLIDRAKGRLMDVNGLTESEAFSFIQKRAMNDRVRMRDVAQLVIDGELAP